MNDDMEVIKSVNAALKSKKLYPSGHPAAAAPLRKTHQLLAELLKEKNNVALGLMDEALVFEEQPVEDSEKLCPELMEHMRDKNVDTIIFERGMTDREISAAFDILSSEEELQGADLQKRLHEGGITHITFKSIPMGKKNLVEIYNGAVDVVKGVMDEVRMGKIPRSEPVNNIVDEVSEAVFSDQNAMIGLTLIKNYDNYLFNHSVNVSVLAVSLGRAMGLEEHELHTIGVAALLHDIGKTGVSENIIRKPGGLSSDEWEKVKQHPLLGSNIIKRMEDLQPTVGRMVYEHHVKFDHSGYPETDSSLHPYSQIITICDAYDALTTLRVYQKPHNPAEAIKVMNNFSGRHFNPDILKAFTTMIGVYPVGTMVRLDSGEIALVNSISEETPDAPRVKVIYDADGNRLDEPEEVDLSEDSRTIVTTVNPATTDLDVAEFFEHEATGTEG